MANAAEAPHIATAPAERIENCGLNPNSRLIKYPTLNVVKTPDTTITTVSMPSEPISPNVMRTPSNTTPIRRTVFEQNTIPGMVLSFSRRKLNAMPRSNAISMAGAP